MRFGKFGVGVGVVFAGLLLGGLGLVAQEAAPVADDAAAEVPAPAAEAAPAAAEVPQPAAAPAAEEPQIEELAPQVAEPKAEVPAEVAPAEVPAELVPTEVAQPAEVVAEPEAPVPAEAAPTEVAAEAPAAVPVEAPAAQVVAEAPAEGTQDRGDQAKLIAAMEEVRRQEQAKTAEVTLKKADAAYEAKQFGEAAKLYREARSKVKPDDTVAHTRIAQRLPEAEYKSILALVSAHKDTEALAAAKVATQQFPEDARLKKLEKKLQDAADERERKRQLAVVVDEGPKTDVQLGRVPALLRAGGSYMAVKDYANAKKSYEAVLALDPENHEAMRLLKNLGDRQYVANTAERAATTADMMAKVRDTWNPPQYKVVEPPRKERSTGPVKNPLLDKMEKIILPQIEFKAANIRDVVDFLNKASIEGDKTETDEARKGVNIILQLGQPSATGISAPPTEGGGLFDEPTGEGGTGGGPSYEISFTAHYISLLQALNIITKVAGLKYVIEGNVVMIVPTDYNPGKIVTRMYPVEPGFLEKMGNVGPLSAPTDGGGGAFPRRMETSDLDTGAPDLRQVFDAMGVPFPKGTSITYNQAISKVIVANTEENLAKFEEVLQELDVTPKQVEIEARFVEVHETDLDELGLEWILGDNWELAVQSGLGPVSGRPRIEMKKNSTDGGFTRGLRFWDQESTGPVAVGGGEGTMGKLLTAASVLTNPELSMVLHALEQNGNADLLSAPKVTTKSGAEASIRVVTEYIYPTSFQVQGGSIQGSGDTAQTIQETVVTPQDFETREVGVILQVLPEVSQDGAMINLTMTPQVVTEPTLHQYGSTIRRSDGSELTLNMPQPFFHVRSITTQIQIYDGATVVMGGLITEDLKKIDDRIPLLGDLPLIGAFFRSTSEMSAKRNLLIFVTARLVDPAGRPIRTPQAASAAGSATTTSTP